MVSLPDFTGKTPAFQAGYTSGAKDAREHRRRNRLLDDLPGLTAFAGDSALLACRRSQPRARSDEMDQYVAGYIQAYQLAAGQPAAGDPLPPPASGKPAPIVRGRLQPMALRRARRSTRRISGTGR